MTTSYVIQHTDGRYYSTSLQGSWIPERTKAWHFESMAEAMMTAIRACWPTADWTVIPVAGEPAPLAQADGCGL